MKKAIFFILSLIFIPVAHASDAAKINIRLSGTINDNRYFLCLPNIGCLSIMVAKKGKIYPIFHSIEMDKIFVLDRGTFRVYPQGLPKSCDVTVNTNQTITISGSLQAGHISGLHCSVKGA